LQDLNSDQTFINTEEVLVQSGLYILGIIVGELVHRISLFIEEYQHILSRHKNIMKKAKKPVRLIDTWLVPFRKAGKAVFSNKHSQFVKAPLLVCLAFFLLYSGDQANICLLDVSRRMCPVVVVWSCLRMFGAFDNSLEDMEILEESNAELGPGLAANYWFSFLKPVLTGDIRQKMEDNLQAVREEQTVGPNYRSFSKLILLLPDDCHLQIKDERILETENIFKCTEVCGNTAAVCDHDLEFKMETGARKPPIKQTVFWIYESSEYEAEAKNAEEKEKKINANKIFIIFDFPQLIQSGMGPNRGWEENDRPGARNKNILSFKKTLKSLLHCNDYIDYEKDMVFLPFPNRERIGEERTTLSEIIREKIREEEQDNVYSSTSATDTEP